MAKNQVNSNQIKDLAVLGRHIGLAEIESTHLKDEAILGQHIALDSITDEHLAIDWGQKASEMLQTKLVIDYVQAQPITVSTATSTVTVSSIVSAPVATMDEPRGVVVNENKNVVLVRLASDLTEPVRDESGDEVRGRITHDGTDFVVNLFTNKLGVETPFEFDVETSIAIQYPQRFDLSSVSEMFGVNEKFVDYGVDTSSRFDINQLVADIFGSEYVLNGVGVASKAETLVAQIATHTSAITALEESVANAMAVAEEAKAATESNATAIEAAQTANTELATRVQTLEDAPAATGGATLVAKRYDKQIVADDIAGGDVEFTIAVDAGSEPNENDFDVYLNGMLQMKGLHYDNSEVVEGKAKVITFAPDALVVGDVVQVRWFA